MSTELATTKAPRGEPVATARAVVAAEALAEEAAQRKLLGEYVRTQMVEGVDYGVIPGTKNKTLLKPGAEKLTQLFRCTPRFAIEEKREEWDTGLFASRFNCQVVNPDGRVVAEGVGSCSTYESRYRWRVQDRKCPHCGKEAIKRSKYPPRDDPGAEPGWYCFAKVGGCGANFAADDPDITDQPTGRVQNPDLIDCVNTVLKIGKKRALVDAAISLARCSDLFTQDLDDDAGGEPDRPAPPPARPQPPKAELDPVTSLTALTHLCSRKGMRFPDDALEWLNREFEASYARPITLGAIPTDQRQALVDALRSQPDAGG